MAARERRWAASVVLVSAASVVVSGCAGGSAPPSAARTTPASPGPSLVGGPTQDSTDVGGKPVGLAAGLGSVWVAVSDQGKVLRLGLDDGTVQQQVPVGDTPLRLAVTPAGVWVSEFRAGTVSLVDASTNRRTVTVPVGAQPEGLTTDGKHLWVVLQQDARLAELDATTGAKVRTVALPSGGEPRLAAYAPAVGGRPATVWVSDYGGNRVVPVEAATGKVGAPVPACAAPQALAVAGRTLWLACQDGWLVTVDLVTHRATRATDLRQLDGNPDAIAVADGVVWTALSTGPVVLRVDPATSTVTGRWEAATDGPLISADVDLVVAAGQVWVSSYNGGTVHHTPVSAVSAS